MRAEPANSRRVWHVWANTTISARSCSKLMKEIRQHRSLCDEIAEKVDRYIEQHTRLRGDK
jgi:nicotinic acid mononucleotide adenylyltransferase